MPAAWLQPGHAPGPRSAGLPHLLIGGGTGLYDTTLAAVRSVRATYDPGAINAW
jgi:hypothetical protein